MTVLRFADTQNQQTILRHLPVCPGGCTTNQVAELLGIRFDPAVRLLESLKAQGKAYYLLTPGRKLKRWFKGSLPQVCQPLVDN